MDDMVERVARALAFLNCSDQAEADHCWRNYCDDARAAIEAMREPLRDALIEAGDDLYSAFCDCAETKFQIEAMTNYANASNTYRAALIQKDASNAR